MRIGRTLPPAAAPLGWADLRNGLAGMLAPARSLRAREEEIRHRFGVRHAFLVSSGTAALTLALKALKSPSGPDQVVIPAYTCFSVPAAVVAAGLKPVACDIDPVTFDFDHALLDRTLTSRTLCVVAHHLFGVPSDVRAVRVACRARGVLVVEDAAQAMGREADGRALGTLGDVGIFSLGRGKNITCGAGGVIVTDEEAIAAPLARQYRRLRRPGAGAALEDLVQVALMALLIRPGLYWLPAALPFLRLGQTLYPRRISLRRLSGFRAGFLRNWRSRLVEANRIRSETVAHFRRRLPAQLARGPAGPCLRLPVLAATAEERRRVLALSRRHGLGIGAAYPTPVSEIPQLAHLFEGQRFPVARAVAERVLTLPTHHWLSDEDKRAIAACVGTMAGAAAPGLAWATAS